MDHQTRLACPRHSDLQPYEVWRPTGWALPFYFGEVCGGLRNIGLARVPTSLYRSKIFVLVLDGAGPLRLRETVKKQAVPCRVRVAAVAPYAAGTAVLVY